MITLYSQSHSRFAERGHHARGNQCGYDTRRLQTSPDVLWK